MSETPEYLTKSQPPAPRPTPPRDESSEPPSDGQTTVEVSEVMSSADCAPDSDNHKEILGSRI